jgi:hypothetical protein
MLDLDLKDFIIDHLSDDLTKLALKKHLFRNIDFDYAFNQINARQKAKQKLPSFYNNIDLIFPESVSIEQSSSELTAKYKSTIIKYETSIDLTGGFGIDSFYFAQNSIKHLFIENNSELLNTVRYNFNLLNIKNMEFINYDAIDILKNLKSKVDLIYIDPSRRSEKGKAKTFVDSSPDIAILLPYLSAKTKYVLIKSSPLLDIKYALNQLNSVEKVIAVSVENECKELLFLLNFEENNDLTLEAVDLYPSKTDNYLFDFISEDKPNYSMPLKYLYEPNSSIMKLGVFNQICCKFSVYKLEKNTHLYTSDTLLENFPGRIFEIIVISKVDRNDLLKIIKEPKANLSIRNFPLTVEDLKKKLKISDGGDFYLFASKIMDGSFKILICKKVDCIK